MLPNSLSPSSLKIYIYKSPSASTSNDTISASREISSSTPFSVNGISVSLLPVIQRQVLPTARHDTVYVEHHQMKKGL